jgi:hypothetical protein
MTHRIRRQILELDLPGEQGAYALQQRASRVFQEQVLPELDRVFSRIAPADRIVRLDRLEVDLGNIGESGWERRFVERCVEQIARQVADAAFEVGEAGRQPETLTPEENAQRVAAHFLETGLLPWYAKNLTVSDLEKTLNALPVEALAAFSRSLLPMLQRDERVVQRLAEQFSAVFSEKIVSIALGLHEAWASRAVWIRQQQTGQAWGRAQRAVFFEKMLGLGGVALQNLPPEPAVLAQFFEEKTRQPAPREAARGDEAQEVFSPKKMGQGGLDDAPAAPRPASEEASAALPAPSRSAEQPTPMPQPSQRPAAQPATERPASRKTAAALAEGVAVESAGLVILGPYLSMFFEHLGLRLSALSPDDALLEAHARAAHLLHYLASGEEQPEEHRLVLPKILCGIPLETPVPQELELSEAEKAEAENLLEAVVRNWPTLKNTSTDGLRNGFLRRNGQVRWQDERQAWTLQVERMAQDILLDRLPWTISTLRLAWMRGLMQVEW